MLSIDSVFPIKLAQRLKNTFLKKESWETEISLEIGAMQGAYSKIFCILLAQGIQT
jgi:hypothetical protein